MTEANEEEEELAQWMPMCDDCENPVEHYCTTCGDKFCTGCRDQHLSSRRYQDHQVVLYSAGMRSANKSKRTCCKHPVERYQLYCKSCLMPVCVQCIAQSHADEKHTFSSIADTYIAAKDKATYCLEKMTNGIRQKIKDHSQKVQDMATVVLDSVDKSENEVKRTCQRLHEIVDLTTEEKLTEIREIKERRILPTLYKQRRSKDEIRSKLERTIKEYEENLRSDDPIDLIVFMTGKDSGTLDSEFPIPITEDIPLLRFFRASISKENMQTHFGSLTLSDERTVEMFNASDVTRSRIEEENAHKEDYGHKPAMITPLNLMETPEQQNEFRLDFLIGNVAKLRHLNADDMWILETGNRVVLVNKVGTQDRTIDCNCEIVLGSGMCTSQSNELMVSDRDGKRLLKISQDFHTSTQFTTESSKPLGISQLDSGECVVCTPDEKVLRLYDDVGKVIREIGKGHLQKPFSVAVNKLNGDFCVSDAFRKVVAFRNTGEKKFVYKGSPDPKFNPYDLCCDKLGYILVTDHSNNRVHIIDKNGRFIQYLVSGERNISEPTTIDICDRGYAWVGEWGTKKVKAFKYLQ